MVIGYNLAIHLDVCVLTDCRLFGSPSFRLDIKCQLVGQCRLFGSIWSASLLANAVFSARRLFGSILSASLLANAVFSARRLFGSIRCIDICVTSHAAPDRRARPEFSDLLPS